MALIFVTGARGSIGQHVVRSARDRGDVVAGVGHGTWTGDRELPKIDFWINGNVTADNLAAMMQQMGRPDVVIHLAGGSLVGSSVHHPSEDFRRTVESSQQLLEWQRMTAPDARVVIASSAAVYGDNHHGMISENANFSPTSPYGAHKAMAELSARSYAQQFGCHLAIVRLFSVYGPGLRKQLIWDVTSRLAMGERAISLGGSGEERRDFVFIADAARLLLGAAEYADASVPVINGCNGRSVRVVDAVEQITSHFPGVAVDFSGAVRPGDPHSLVGNPDNLRKIGLSTPTELAEGIAETVAWVKRIVR